jgi:hypothetical protein
MKSINHTILIILGLSLTGCTSSKIADLDARISVLEKHPPAIDELTQKVLNIAIGGPDYHNTKPSKIDAVLALALFERIETAPDILRLAQATQNNHFRMECVNALGWMKYEKAVPYLKDRMKNDSYEHTRRAAAEALENITNETFVTPENGFETNEMKMGKYKKQLTEKQRIKEDLANKKLDPTVETPVDSGKEQGTAGQR